MCQTTVTSLWGQEWCYALYKASKFWIQFSQLLQPLGSRWLCTQSNLAILLENWPHANQIAYCSTANLEADTTTHPQNAEQNNSKTCLANSKLLQSQWPMQAARVHGTKFRRLDYKADKICPKFILQSRSAACKAHFGPMRSPCKHTQPSCWVLLSCGLLLNV